MNSNHHKLNVVNSGRHSYIFLVKRLLEKNRRRNLRIYIQTMLKVMQSYTHMERMNGESDKPPDCAPDQSNPLARLSPQNYVMLMTKWSFQKGTMSACTSLRSSFDRNLLSELTTSLLSFAHASLGCIYGTRKTKCYV